MNNNNQAGCLILVIIIFIMGGISSCIDNKEIKDSFSTLCVLALGGVMIWGWLYSSKEKKETAIRIQKQLETNRINLSKVYNSIQNFNSSKQLVDIYNCIVFAIDFDRKKICLIKKSKVFIGSFADMIDAEIATQYGSKTETYQIQSGDYQTTTQQWIKSVFLKITVNNVHNPQYSFDCSCSLQYAEEWHNLIKLVMYNR
ncbi:MAG: hypothetical protein HQK67_07130 [Desulfamplus sp.]|nr:hypothetical protein [Desulfamplus sp.]